MNNRVTIIDWQTNYEEKVREEFLWALGPNALNEMTKSAYGENPTEMKIDRLIKLYRENFMPKRNTIYSRGDFFWARQKAEETPEEHWKKLNRNRRKLRFSKFRDKTGRPTNLEIYNINYRRKIER